MAIKKTESGWKVDVRPNGRDGKRVRRTFKTQAEARRFENKILAQVADGQQYAPLKRDRRRLMEFATLWYDVQGVGLKDGRGRYRKMQQLAGLMGNPVLSTLTPMDMVRFRQQRLDAGISPNTTNHDLAHLRAMVNVAIRMGEYRGENPFAAVKAIRLPETELSYLDQEGIDVLFSQLRQSRNAHVMLVARLCLNTGCRWSEAQTLRSENVQHGRVTYVGTKNGRNRTVPLPADLFDELKAHGPRIGRLFPQDAYQAFSLALNRSGIELPKGQRTHVLRHTFASHFIMNGGDLLTLQKILGHRTIQMTMRYAHLSPDHLADSIKYGPKFECGQSVDTVRKWNPETGRKVT
ncbi:tyrosine-type recombinase/integrase [Salinicola sp. CR57]|uniref:phage integrase n=1 Tax=Salinicola sp. CR57 TaxID=1949086 RepID=UPI001E354189|nr:tyrosine-type recombinase/integrase [Salinicola sp. CR57]